MRSIWAAHARATARLHCTASGFDRPSAKGYGLATTASGESGARRKLPIGIQTFRDIREDGFYYVDKTALIGRLVDGGKHYFLSRPRRFGKSLLLDTIKELFEGSEALFRELAIHKGWDWTPHPVVRLSFGSGNFTEPLAQVKARGYADKYRQPGRPIHLIGVEFSREARNIAAFEVERAA